MGELVGEIQFHSLSELAWFPPSSCNWFVNLHLKRTLLVVNFFVVVCSKKKRKKVRFTVFTAILVQLETRSDRC
jgi:hypothetical protein